MTFDLKKAFVIPGFPSKVQTLTLLTIIINYKYTVPYVCEADL